MSSDVRAGTMTPRCSSTRPAVHSPTTAAPIWCRRTRPRAWGTASGLTSCLRRMQARPVARRRHRASRAGARARLGGSSGPAGPAAHGAAASPVLAALLATRAFENGCAVAYANGDPDTAAPAQLHCRPRAASCWPATAPVSRSPMCPCRNQTPRPAASAAPPPAAIPETYGRAVASRMSRGS